MTKDEVLAIFRECGAMLEGHFILSSGLRSVDTSTQPSPDRGTRSAGEIGNVSAYAQGCSSPFQGEVRWGPCAP